MRAMVAHVVSMVVASTDQSLVAASTLVNLGATNIPAASLVAANIRAESIVGASMVSVVATVNIATEPERLRCALCQRNSPARLCRRDVSKWEALQVGE